MVAVLFFAWQIVKIEKKKRKEKVIIFMKFMEKEVKKVRSPQDLNLRPKNYLVPPTSPIGQNRRYKKCTFFLLQAPTHQFYFQFAILI